VAFVSGALVDFIAQIIWLELIKNQHNESKQGQQATQFKTNTPDLGRAPHQRTMKLT
jgi:hypothetical protein